MSQVPSIVFERMKKFGIWSEACPVPLDRLRYLSIEYVNFHGVISTGNIIVLDVVADYTSNIFEELKKQKFPIFQIKTIDEYEGNDERSMEANNSSAFNYRKIQALGALSIHSYGLAIDINPLQNPYLVKKDGRVLIFPSAGENFLDRSKSFHGKITSKVVEIFRKNKFIVWGGSWKEPVDYHHFEIPRVHAEKLIQMTFKEGKKYLDSDIFS